MSAERGRLDAQLAAGRQIASRIINDLATERGAHAETVIAAAARMGGTILFRTFGLPSNGVVPGTPVLSDIANERGPVLVEVMKGGLAGLGIEINERALPVVTPDHASHFSVIETQQKLDVALYEIAASNGLSGESAARACALASAMLIHQTRSVLEPALGFAIAVHGFVEGTKTMPMPTGDRR